MANTTEPTYRRASEFIAGIGDNLDGIQGRDLLLRSVEISKRPMRGKDTDFVSLQISEMDALDTVNEYHAWSGPLAEKLGGIPETSFPVVVKFVREATSSGFRIWSIE